MHRVFSQKLRSDVYSAVQKVAASGSPVNVPYLAELLRLQNLSENVAREDVEWLIVRQAEAFGIAMAFSSEPSDLPVWASAN